ncbi:proteasome accessory factor PafA2 family protein [Arthrobacter alpinus]|nr:proteasome accessory factor PafA2 family protein [Arthrobacter alpinus]
MGRSSNVFLPNGSRLYLDVGSHPEYATAECDGIAQLIAQDRAGELILHDLVQEAQAKLTQEGYGGKISCSRTMLILPATPTAATRTT